MSDKIKLLIGYARLLNNPLLEKDIRKSIVCQIEGMRSIDVNEIIDNIADVYSVIDMLHYQMRDALYKHITHGKSWPLLKYLILADNFNKNNYIHTSVAGPFVYHCPFEERVAEWLPAEHRADFAMMLGASKHSLAELYFAERDKCASMQAQILALTAERDANATVSDAPETVSDAPASDPPEYSVHADSTTPCIDHEIKIAEYRAKFEAIQKILADTSVDADADAVARDGINAADNNNN
jgi:hypothetical protein